MLSAASLTDDLYHYTSATVGIDSIVQQMQLRLGLFEATNDPRESKPRYAALAAADGVSTDSALTESIWREADRMVRRSAKVACFTLDFELPDNVLDAQAHRGYAHPALWAHYGGGHSGVCLRFSRAALTERFQDALKNRSHLFEGPVEYRPSLMDDALEPLDLEQISEFGLDAVVHLFVRRHHRSLFFRKHADWANEREYRWVALDPTPLPIYVDIAGCLRGVVLGDAFAPSREQAVQLLAQDRGLTVRRVRFFDGRLLLVPAMPSPMTAPSITARRPGLLEERVDVLARVEESVAEAQERGAATATPFLGRMSATLEEIAARIDTAGSVEVVVMKSAAGVPVAERRRAPGTPRAIVEYQGGWMCVVENLPKQSATLVAALAVQVLEGSRLKCHAVYQTELWSAAGNERAEVWRRACEMQLHDDALHRMVEDLLDAFVDHLDIALRAFEQIRRGAPATWEALRDAPLLRPC